VKGENICNLHSPRIRVWRCLDSGVCGERVSGYQRSILTRISRHYPTRNKVKFLFYVNTGGFKTTSPTKMIRLRRPIRPANIKFDSAACLLCQWRAFSASYRRLAEKETPAPPPPKAPGPLDEAPRSYGKAVSEFTPKPLSRPIGLPNPPRPGENTGIDARTWKQRRDDFVDYDKHLIRRKEL